mmetsp:Transcript_26894/g.63178  ORF Transcript_26894/g.63178 Transcript_26894/m.63178 type:complete len:406 (-) Transcript_26894:232-1449(-)
MKLLLDHVDSPYIRGIGFLYLRFAGEPSSIWGWIEPYLYDDEPIVVAEKSAKSRAHQGQKTKDETIGDFVRRIFSTERDFHGTMLPRLPIQIERDLQDKLAFAKRIQSRAEKHLLDRKAMEYFKTLGSRVMALYGDDENPITWYEGVVDRVVLRDELTSRHLTAPKFVVTFPEYGNTETVTLGEIEMMGAPLDSVNKEKPNRGDRREFSSFSRNDGDADRNRDRRFVGGKEKGYGRSDRNYGEGSGSSNEKYYDRDDNRRGIVGTSRGYSSGNGRRRGENKNRRGYHATYYDDNRGGRSRGGDTGGYSTSQPQSSNDLHIDVRAREQTNAIAKGGKVEARKPTEKNMSARGHRDTNRVGGHEDMRFLQSTPLLNESAKDSGGEKRSAAEDAAQKEKRRKLMTKYG